MLTLHPAHHVRLEITWTNSLDSFRPLHILILPGTIVIFYSHLLDQEDLLLEAQGQMYPESSHTEMAEDI